MRLARKSSPSAVTSAAASAKKRITFWLERKQERKLDKAKELGVKVIDESEFKKML